ncbi:MULTISPECIES: bleomycin resistance protein [Pectobacterium]|uniref:bleomycin resistance protein n=1 Tax=Pectobacterium TaxID=122277 RepID=UPI00102F0010|nr:MULTISPECIES: VOC family protein [Pectobacterium]MBA0170641.1 VOC family protein [Pectobacterium versatile]MBN3238133.1 VOC family protein [Pectobacterium versatile]MBQ4782245.1 VOC family protein [Pectobacterium versatile]MBQ4786745.1 VOC family protein [Pectobacterium versatile]MCA6914261.1 VOC family protein [Pectobacterium versatile]
MRKMNTLIPEMIVSDLQKSLVFYCHVLGFQIEYDRPEDKFAFLSFHGSQLMLEQDYLTESPWRVEPLEPPFGRGMNLSIECPDAQALAAAIERAGYTLRRPVETCWYRDHEVYHGESNFLVQDPDGYLLRFTQSLGCKSSL